jgi:hypothetical protein
MDSSLTPPSTGIVTHPWTRKGKLGSDFRGNSWFFFIAETVFSNRGSSPAMKKNHEFPRMDD